MIADGAIAIGKALIAYGVAITAFKFAKANPLLAVIAGAGLDVYEKEPLPEGNKLRFLPNALLMPHVGYVTAENYSIFYTQMIEGLEACVAGKPLRVLE